MDLDLDHFEIIDISPVINSDLAVFPGDKTFERKESLSFKKGDNLVLSSISTTLHIGAHTDAPIHYHPKGTSIEKRPLSTYLGSCQVITANGAKNGRIFPEHLDLDSVVKDRVLIRTNSYPNPKTWNNDFWALSVELVSKLAQKGVKVIGIDTPSVDPANDKNLETHNEIYKHDMAIIEGIVLDKAKDGHYQLIALPLAIAGADASPIRAILLKDKK